MSYMNIINISRSVVSHCVWPHRWQPTRLLCLWDSPGKNTGVACQFVLQCRKVKSESEQQIKGTRSDRVPDELWTEVRDTVQEAGIKTIPKKKKCKKANWLSEEALQIAVKRREVKSKGEKEGYSHLNAEFQRIARRHKKTFLSQQYKEIEENNRMGKNRDLF